MQRTLPAALLCAACALAAGCGSSATAGSSSKAVQVSLLAPTDGATVVVSDITVAGTVAPSDAVLRVSGRQVHVAGGAFRKPLSLHKGLNRIRIIATAAGYARSTRVVRVRYAPRRPAVGTAGAGASGGAVAQFSSGFEQVIVDGCEAGDPGKASYCTCVVERMVRAGYRTQAQWESIVEGWRRSFLANGVISYPPAMKDAVVSCVRRYPPS